MALGIYTGGTTGGTDGTAVGTVGNPLNFASVGLNQTLAVHLRCTDFGADDIQFADAADKLQISYNGSTWYDLSAEPAVTVGSVNVPAYLRQKAVAASASGTFTSTGIYDIDATPPTLAGTLAPTVVSSSRIDLDWPDATDNIAVTGYDVEYGTTTGYGSTITDPTTSTASITGLSTSTLYYFRVRAYDAAGNTSGWLTASATTSADSDTTAPSQVTGLSAVMEDTVANLSWTAATDNVAVTGYTIEYKQVTSDPGTGTWTGSTTTTSATNSKQITGLSGGASYWFRVSAYDAASNNGAWSSNLNRYTIKTTNLVVWLDAAKSNSALTGPNTNSDGNKGTFYDRSGSARDFTVNNAGYTTSSGWAGDGSTSDPYAFVADGVNDYLSRADESALDLTWPFSFEFWVKSDQAWSSYATGTYPTILDKLATSPATTRNYVFYATPKDVNGNASPPSIHTGVSGTAGNPGVGVSAYMESGDTGLWNDTNWHHVAVIFSGTTSSATATFVIDGVARATKHDSDSTSWPITFTTPFSGYTNNAAVNILNRSDALSVCGFKGRIAAFRLHSSPLSTTDVANHYDSERARFGL